MPWSPGDAYKHIHAAGSAKKSKVWSSTANGVLADSGDEGKAIRIANAQVAGTINHKRKKSKLHSIMRSGSRGDSNA